MAWGGPKNSPLLTKKGQTGRASPMQCDPEGSKMAQNGQSTCCWSFGTILGQFATKVLSSKRLISSWKCPKASNRPQIISNRFFTSSTRSFYSRPDILVTHHPPNHIFRSHRSSKENYIYEHSCHCTMWKNNLKNKGQSLNTPQATWSNKWRQLCTTLEQHRHHLGTTWDNLETIWKLQLQLQ